MSGRPATETIIPGRAALSVGNPGTPAPTGWKWTSLYDVSVLGTGHTPTRKNAKYWNGDIPWIGIRDAAKCHGGVITDTAHHVTPDGLANSAARLLPAGTVCLSRTASVGYVVQMGRDMATSQDFVTWTCNEGLEPRFLMYALLAEGDEIRRFGKGSTHTTIYFPEVKAFHICLPPVAEQLRIVAKLDSLIERTHRAREELSRIPMLVEHYKQAILEMAFRGELTAAWRSEVGIDSATWTEQSIDKLLYGIKAGKNLRCEERQPRRQEKGVVKVSAVTWGVFDPTQSKTLPGDFIPNSDTVIKKGDFLFSRANTIELVGACVIVNTEPYNLYLSDKILRLDLREKEKPWLLWFLRSPQGRSRLEDVSSGNQLSMRNISQKGLRSIQVPFPTEPERIEIVRRIENDMDRLNCVLSEQEKATHLLDYIDQANLTKAFRGELVAQDPTEEPASVLIGRIRAERDAEPKPKRRRRTVSA